MGYNETLNLPKTEFPMRANLAQNEPPMVAAWDEGALYQRIIAKNADKPKFLMHDGPPYANGHIHSGHILNKILKDMVVKYRNLAGYRCEFIPGWDCHGLPIEVQVDKDLGKKKRDMSPVEFRRACREYAQRFVAIQRDEFKRFGVLARWAEPYLTMDNDYEARIVHEIGRFFLNGGVYKGLKPVYWCPVHRTALAEAEVEYQEHTSPSIYVKFPVKAGTWPFSESKPVSVAIWTTTPWTLPANLAVALHPDFEYATVDLGDELIVVAKEMVETVAAACHWQSYTVTRTFASSELEHTICRHPFIERDSLVVYATYVTLDSGTGCVHTAPGHGQDDYITGLKYGLEPYAPVDGAGRFTDDVPQWAGESIFAANPKIVAFLHETGYLLNPPTDTLTHSYPHSWRSHKPVIFRATEQWFISMTHNDLRQNALAAIDQVEWLPHWGRNRIYGMMENRPDWCISRQRYWGVPIPAFTCQSCQETTIDETILQHLLALIREHSTDVWYERDTKALLPPGTRCAHCGSAELLKDDNILDVWFESGVSYAAVMEPIEGFGVTTDLYIEGSDQHRGWFHSSLLASVGTRGRAPYKSVVTHGFVVDGEGKKISKSKGNYIPPEKIIQKNGAELMRLWVAGEDYREDVRLSNEILSRLSEAYRKIRNTMRFFLGNLSDFDPNRDAVPPSDLLTIDRWALSKFQHLVQRIQKSYEEYTFHVIFHSAVEFMTVSMSAFYLDILKDRLYVEGQTSLERRSAQTAMYEIARGMTVMLAPMLSFTAEEVWRFLPKRAGDEDSVFLSEFPTMRADWIIDELEGEWEQLRIARNIVLKALEAARNEKLIGKSLDAGITLHVRSDAPYAAALAAHEDELPVIFIVSQVALNLGAQVDGDEAMSVVVANADGRKCERCWIYNTDVGADTAHVDVCGRCASVLNTYHR